MTKSRLVILILVFCWYLPPVRGQSAEDMYRPVLAVKYNPLAMLAYTPGIEMGLEHTISEHATIHLGGSYLSDFGIFPNKDFTGYKLIGEYRKYRFFKNTHPNAFLALHMYVKRTNTQGQAYLNRANGNYQQLSDVAVTNSTIAGLVAYGKVFNLSQKVSLDIALALGTKRLTVASDDVPPDAALGLFNDTIFDFTVNELGSGWYPLFRIHVKCNVALYD